MNKLNSVDQQRFKELADQCVAQVDTTGNDAELDDDIVHKFIEVGTEMLEKSESRGLRYGGRIFFAEFGEDEEGPFVAGIQWINESEIMDLNA